MARTARSVNSEDAGMTPALENPLRRISAKSRLPVKEGVLRCLETPGNMRMPIRGVQRLVLAAIIGAISFAGRGQPAITIQPTSQTVWAGGTASFIVAVAGSGPFTYQWQRNGSNLPLSMIT